MFVPCFQFEYADLWSACCSTVLTANSVKPKRSLAWVTWTEQIQQGNWSGSNWRQEAILQNKVSFSYDLWLDQIRTWDLIWDFLMLDLTYLRRDWTYDLKEIKFDPSLFLQQDNYRNSTLLISFDVKMNLFFWSTDKLQPCIYFHLSLRLFLCRWEAPCTTQGSTCPCGPTKPTWWTSRGGRWVTATGWRRSASTLGARTPRVPNISSMGRAFLERWETRRSDTCAHRSTTEQWADNHWWQTEQLVSLFGLVTTWLFHLCDLPQMNKHLHVHRSKLFFNSHLTIRPHQSGF